METITEVSDRTWVSKIENAMAANQRVIRFILFFYLIFAFCPITYLFPIPDSEATWYFALNYAAVHHLGMGRDIVWTTGPLSYLILPMDLGNNLMKALLFQVGMWAFVIAVVYDICFHVAFRLRNLAFFAVFIGLSARLYQYPTIPGASDVLLAGAMLLLLNFHLYGGWWRYSGAVIALSLLPLFKIADFILVMGIVAGLILELLIRERTLLRREFAFLLAVPVLVMLGFWLTIGNWVDVGADMKGFMELTHGYSAAMSVPGPRLEIIAAFASIGLLIVALTLLARDNRRFVYFFAVVFSIPIVLSFKHGFVRQDLHPVYFFCFVSLLLAMTMLIISLGSLRRVAFAGVLLLLMGTIWIGTVGRIAPKTALAAVIDARPLLMLTPVARFQHFREKLRAEEIQSFTPGTDLEGEIRRLVGTESVASLSIIYTYAKESDLNLYLYPVIERYSAYTPYLDQLNAAWVRANGPKFLIFDAIAIDRRQPWTETPAMWLEIYRWYDLAFLGERNILLQRRLAPRFSGFRSDRPFDLKRGEAIHFSADQKDFWKLNCQLNVLGRIRELIFRIPDVDITLHDKTKGQRTFRIIPAVMDEPMPAGQLPSDLREFAEYFRGDQADHTIESVTLGGPGLRYYQQECSAEFLNVIP